MSFTLVTFIEWFSGFFWAVIRVGGFVMTVPIFGNQLISPRIKIALSAAIALAISPTLTAMPLLTSFGVDTIVQVMVQLLSGIGLGFATVIFFQLFVVAGQFVGMQMGLGFASMVDPGNGITVTVWSQFFLMLVTLTFISMNGHLVLLEVLIEGFKASPTGVTVELKEMVWSIAALGGWMFSGGILIALPAVMSLLIVNVAFGIMSRSAPQLNIFSLGFPFSLLFGLVIIWVLISQWEQRFTVIGEEFFRFTRLWSGAA